MNTESRILAAQIDGVVWLRVSGKGSLQNSPALKRYVGDCISDGQATFVVDLEDCTGMDSTFMGTLTGIAVLLGRRPGPSQLKVINAAGRNRQLLENLGLDQVLDLDVTGETWKSQRALVSRIFAARGAGAAVPDPDINGVEHAELVLAAHEALGEANSENIPRFRDVVEYLKQDLENRRL